MKSNYKNQLIFASLVCLPAGLLDQSFGQEPPAEEQTPQAPAEKALPKPPKVEPLSPGVFRIADQILLDMKKREIRFSAVCNQVRGLVEYGLVHENGKTHESLFRTKISPRNLQTALLLARVEAAKGFVENLWKEEREKIDVSASQLTIMVSWKSKNEIRAFSLESMATNANTNKPIAPNSFVFNGSRFVEGIFMAEQSGSIVAVYADDTSMINSGDYGANNDDVWVAQKEKMPPLDFPVTFTLKFPPKKLPLKEKD
jgi:hypothetical protein